MKRIAALLCILIFLIPLTVAAESETLYFLYSEHCIVCVEAGEYINELEQEHGVVVVRYEREEEAFMEVINKHNIERITVPIIIYKDSVWQGFNPVIKNELAHRMNLNIEEDFGFLSGRLNQGSLIATTIMIGLIDGFNPCSLWALMFLISMVIRFNSRKIMLIVGVAFVLTVSLVYGLFIAGVFTIVYYIIDIFWLRFLLFSLALTFALITLKDVFYKQDIGLGISQDNKKKFILAIREKLFSQENAFGLIVATILVALFASLIELPCTAGFPIVWNGIVAEQQVGIASYVSLLAIYLLMYVLVELSLVGFMVFTLSKAHMNLKIGKSLKFLSGMLMTYLAILLLLGQKYLNDINFVVGGSLIIIAISLIIVFFMRKKFARNE